MSNDLIEAVASVIHATGFHAMAREYRERPEYRSRIEAAMCRNINREFGAEKAKAFSRLIDNAHRCAV